MVSWTGRSYEFRKGAGARAQRHPRTTLPTPRQPQPTPASARRLDGRFRQAAHDGLQRSPCALADRRPIGRHGRSGVDAHGWLWEIRRGPEWPENVVRRVLVEVSGSAWKVDPSTLADDTAAAIRSEGQSEVERVLDLEEPPQIILCTTVGCSPREHTAQTDL
jgi:hypothetical protein